MHSPPLAASLKSSYQTISKTGVEMSLWYSPIINKTFHESVSPGMTATIHAILDYQRVAQQDYRACTDILMLAAGIRCSAFASVQEHGFYAHYIHFEHFCKFPDMCSSSGKSINCTCSKRDGIMPITELTPQCTVRCIRTGQPHQ